MTNQDKRLTFIALNVSDLNRSFEFYTKLLGIPLTRSDHDADLDDLWYGGDHAAFSWTTGGYLHFALYPAKEPHRPVTRASQIGFHIDDFNNIHQHMIAANIAVLEHPRDEPWGLTARYLDPDGNIVSITKNEAS